MIYNLRHQYEVLQCQILKYLMRGLLQHWTKSSIILTSKEESVWRNKRPRSRTVCFAAGRLLTWSMITSGSLESMILSKNYADLFTICLRNDEIQEFDSKWDGILLSMTQNPIWWHLGRIVQSKNTRVWETQDRVGIAWRGRFIRRKLDLIISDWRQWWKEVSGRIYELRILKPEAEIMRQTPWSRIREQNSVS